MLCAALLAGWGAPTVASAAGKPKRPKAPKLTALHCFPKTSAACKSRVKVEIGDDVALRGQRLARKQKVTFTWSKGRTTGKLRRAAGAWLVRVPAGTAVGTVRVTVKDRRGKKSNAKKLSVLAATADGAATDLTAVASGRSAFPDAFRGAGLWVVDLPEADGGTADALIARARAARASTVLLRLPNLGRGLGEFNGKLVADLKAGGVQLCAWQYLFGVDPAAEAALAIEAVKAGAACLVMNVEIEYRGKYADARRYLDLLRAGIGQNYPLGLTSFFNPASHPDTPISVFLGPGGAQVNMPQVYWTTAGTTPGAMSIAAAKANRIYGRPLAPLGETAGASYDDVLSFRSIWAAYGAQGLGWYRWQGTTPEGWNGLAQLTPAFDPPADPGWLQVTAGARGDSVRWLQRHLAAFDGSVAIDGTYGAGTMAAVRAFQASRGLPVTGTVADKTWPELLKLTPKDG